MLIEWIYETPENGPVPLASILLHADFMIILFWLMHANFFLGNDSPLSTDVAKKWTSVRARREEGETERGRDGRRGEEGERERESYVVAYIYRSLYRNA